MTTDFVHWRDITPPVPDQGQYGGIASIRSVSFLTPEQGWVVVGLPTSALELYRTTDGGATWQDEGGVTSGGAAGQELIDFVDPSHGWREVIAPTAGMVALASTDDGGETWTSVPNPDRWPSDGVITLSSESNGFVANTLPPSQDLASDEPISSFASLQETRDGGQTWQPAALDLPSGFTEAQSYTGLPTLSSADDGVLPVVLFEQNTMSVAFYLTSNEGASWSYQSLLGVGSTAGTGVSLTNQLPSVSVAGPDAWWVISGLRPNGSPEVHVTNDAGSSWTTVFPNGLPSTLGALSLQGAPVEAISATTAWVMLAGEPGCNLYGTIDGGTTWSPVCPN